MQLLSLVLAGFIATGMAFPAPLIPRSDSPIDNSTICTNHNPALANAIGKMCAREGGLVVGNDWTISESSHEYKHDPHPAEVVVQGSRDSKANGPPEDVTDVCMEIFWALCRARIENGRRGVALERGKNNCQYWFIPGWDEDNFSGYEWGKLKYLSMVDILPPVEVAAPVGEPTSSSSTAVPTTEPMPSSVTRDGIFGGALTSFLALARPTPTPKATASPVREHAGHRNQTLCSHTPSPCAHSSRTTTPPRRLSTSGGSSRPTGGPS